MYVYVCSSTFYIQLHVWVWVCKLLSVSVHVCIPLCIVLSVWMHILEFVFFFSHLPICISAYICVCVYLHVCVCMCVRVYFVIQGYVGLFLTSYLCYFLHSDYSAYIFVLHLRVLLYTSKHVYVHLCINICVSLKWIQVVHSPCRTIFVYTIFIFCDLFRL